MNDAIIYRVPWSNAKEHDFQHLIDREWLVTNGLGGYSSGTIAGICTRRYHGLLVAALPAPLGRMMMFNHMIEQVRLPDGTILSLAGDSSAAALPPEARFLSSFRLENGLPMWRYEVGPHVLEKRVLLQYRANTVHLIYRLLEGDSPIGLRLRPGLHFRAHESAVDSTPKREYTVQASGDRFEISSHDLPPLKMQLREHPGAFVLDGGRSYEVDYALERDRGYADRDVLWSPGYFRTDLAAGQSIALVASTEPWNVVLATSPTESLEAEHLRRKHLVEQAPPQTQSGLAAELVLAADQFVIVPTTRVADEARAHAAGDESRSVIAGYHWFTDWGRDTMICLEGLTLCTGRSAEAGYILRTFANYVRDGLIPNLFPEGEQQGLYHTADATLWYFHALDRYLQTTGDRATLRAILPKLEDIIEHHLRGTRFGIGMDPSDGLLRQGQEGYQLTWMDAKVADWVVTPRRGKAVEINALWYNALRLLSQWLAVEGADIRSRELQAHADRAYESFNARFWSPQHGWLYDVVDGEGPDDASLRPNQLFSISLPHPVLAERHWSDVVDVVHRRLLTPVGLRSLAPGEPDYKSKYDGDLRARDAAYHQGTVWAWLIGPFIDAWLKVHPAGQERAREFLQGFKSHLSEACIGSISEVFDAEAPFQPRGCVAQAWSVAEVLRSWIRTGPPAPGMPS
jgi:predicted glycogen debranching enzyme